MEENQRQKFLFSLGKILFIRVEMFFQRASSDSLECVLDKKFQKNDQRNLHKLPSCGDCGHQLTPEIFVTCVASPEE